MILSPHFSLSAKENILAVKSIEDHLIKADQI